MSIATFRLAREAEEAKLKAAEEKPAEPVAKEPEVKAETTSTATASMKAKPKTTLKSES